MLCKLPNSTSLPCLVQQGNILLLFCGHSTRFLTIFEADKLTFPLFSQHCCLPNSANAQACGGCFTNALPHPLQLHSKLSLDFFLVISYDLVFVKRWTLLQKLKKLLLWTLFFNQKNPNNLFLRCALVFLRQLPSTTPSAQLRLDHLLSHSPTQFAAFEHLTRNW